MSDIAVPSWRPRQEKPAVSGRLLALAGGMIGLAALGVAGVWGVSRMGPRPVPVIEADPRPLKIRPDAPGGLIVPNQDQIVLEGAAQRRAAERSRTAIAQLDAGSEAPALDLLRQHVGPPTMLAEPVPVPAAPVPASAVAQSALGAATASLPPPVALAVTATVAAPTVVAATAAWPQAVAGGRAHAQFGALNSEEAARSEWERLVRRVPELAAFQPRITRLDREGQPTLWRLRAAGLADAAAAKALCDAVRARNIACLPSPGGSGA